MPGRASRNAGPVRAGRAVPTRPNSPRRRIRATAPSGRGRREGSVRPALGGSKPPPDWRREPSGLEQLGDASAKPNSNYWRQRCVAAGVERRTAAIWAAAWMWSDSYNKRRHHQVGVEARDAPRPCRWGRSRHDLTVVRCARPPSARRAGPGRGRRARARCAATRACPGQRRRGRGAGSSRRAAMELGGLRRERLGLVRVGRRTGLGEELAHLAPRALAVDGDVVAGPLRGTHHQRQESDRSANQS